MEREIETEEFEKWAAAFEKARASARTRKARDAGDDFNADENMEWLLKQNYTKLNPIVKPGHNTNATLPSKTNNADPSMIMAVVAVIM